jgi:phosphosulfolactate phosphohydrolase-like enzyme
LQKLEPPLKITVYSHPKDVKVTIVQNATVVLVDILRLTTTAAMYLYHGAAGVGIFSDPGSAKKAFEKQKRGEGLLAGERDWEKIPGFHLSLSPLESNREKVKDRFICISSQSTLRVPKAKHILLGSFINLNDVYDSCLRAKNDVVVICAGEPEDMAFAGMLVDFLQSTLISEPIVLAESAKDAINYYRPWSGRLLDMLKETTDGKELVRKGYVKDLDLSTKLNKVSAVPYFKDGFFLKEDTPRPRRLLDEAKAKAAAAKGKSIKVTVPLFPKNPEHPVPGMDKKKGAAADDKKNADKKGDKVDKNAPAAKNAPVLKKGEKGEKPAKVKKAPKPMFGKKTTVAAAAAKLAKKAN